MDRFIDVYNSRLSNQIKKYLVIENDDRLFTVEDCPYINKHTKRDGVPDTHKGIPVLFDNLHHACLHNNEPMLEAMTAVFATWYEHYDGLPLTDYSTQDPNKLNHLGAHTENIDDVYWEAYMR